ncbi:hypothetical protein ABZ016_16605 [Streptomyces sp. NPDC006372]
MGAIGALLLWPRHDGQGTVAGLAAPDRHTPSKDRSALAKAA